VVSSTTRTLVQRLAFNLRHNISSTFVNASRRSSGFTHFFTLKTILHARERESLANSYIYRFDEPGTYLHPSGQADLIRELDAISRANQVVYATHSIFLVNRTFPARHRLIVKDQSGTRIDGKPYLGRWERLSRL
jgi:predicted ATPase